MKQADFANFMRDKMDSISSTFCAAKWYNATIWLNHGRTVSCHHPAAHTIPISEIKYNPSAIHNTAYKKEMRRQMVNGERPQECKYCWDVEDLSDTGIFSDRIYKTVIHDGFIDKETITNSIYDDVKLRTLEVSFDSTCNFACAYCSPTFSTTWQKIVKKHGPMEGISSPDVFQYQTEDGLWKSEKFKKDENPYIDAFWKWWPELSTSLEELRITGGEPLMSTDVWKLIDVIIEHNKTKRPIKLAINTNLGAKDDLIDKFANAAAILGTDLNIYTSGEAFGKPAEFVRNGLAWEKWVSNCERLLSGPKLSSFVIMTTVNALSFYTLNDFCNLIYEWKQRFPHQRISLSGNILKNPDFLQISVLPNDIKTAIISKIRNNPVLLKFEQIERNGIERILAYAESKNHAHLLADLKTFIEQYAKRTNMNPAEYLDREVYEHIYRG